MPPRTSPKTSQPKAPDSSKTDPKRSGAPKGQQPADMVDTSRAILDETVRIITGRDDIPPRTGQARLLEDIAIAFARTHASAQETGGQALGAAPTGTGKSAAYLTAAAAAAALMGERTVISTEMISLQTQLIDKDAPVVAEACERITGFRPKTALLKGWSNYGCTAAAVDAAQEIVGDAFKTDLDLILDLRTRLDTHMAKGTTQGADRDEAALVRWTLDEAATLAEKGRTPGTGDKNTYEGNLSDSRMWDKVSVSSSDCVGPDRCSLADFCLPRRARDEAAEADIIVTNHHLLAVQAAKNVPVIIGSTRLGEIQHVVVDEAHGLPSIVRSQGAVEVSERTMMRTVRSITRVLDERDKNVADLVTAGEAISHRIGEELSDWAARIKRGEDVYRLTDGEDPVNDTALLVDRWATQVRSLLKAAGKTANVAEQMKVKRIQSLIDTLTDAVSKIAEHEVGSARWVEIVTPHHRPDTTNQRREQPYPSAKYTPVDVSSMLRFGLWTVEDKDAEKDDTDATQGGPLDSNANAAGPAVRKALTVVALSATLPRGFARDAAIKAPIVAYESPFDTAYGNSALFVPRANPGSADVAALKRPGWDQPKFDTGRHTAWAIKHIVDLVEANGGSALVLAATATAGREYAAALGRESKRRWRVLSQWDGPPLRKQVADWKADHSAVLVGTKSLFTGVDAAGETCTLVIVDRPARARSNPVDDARVEMLVKDAQMDRWAADRLVYVSDASALLEQAAGRLIRQVADSGMVAVLDPRLLKSSPFSYNEATRKDYLEALHRFTKKIADPADAHRWLREHRATVEARATA